MYVPSVIAKKRDGLALDDDEIRELIARYGRGDLPEEQMAALAMAVYFRGLDDRETATWTEAMLRSGGVLDFRDLGRPVVIQRRVEVPVHPFKASVNGMLADDVVDVGDRGQTRVPHSLCMVAPEAFHEFAQACIADHREVRAGIPGIRAGAATTFEDHDPCPSPGEQVCRGETSDAAADHYDVEGFAHA